MSLNMTGQFVGSLLRPHAEFLRPLMDKGVPLDDIFEGAREAGYELVKDREMSERTLQKISREMIDQKTYVERINKAYERAMGLLQEK